MRCCLHAALAAPLQAIPRVLPARTGRVLWTAALFLCALISCGAVAAAGQVRGRLAIENVRIVDVSSGRLTGVRTVLIAEGRIVAVGAPAAVRVPADAVRIDGRSRFLLPGLVDLHVHLFNHASGRAPNDWTFPLFLAHGVTAVREMNAQPGDAVVLAGWQDNAAAGVRLAPRILGVGMVVRDEHADQALAAVAAAKDAGATFIKVFSDIGAQAWRQVLRRAAQQRLPVMGHVPATVDVLAAARAGQRSAEHLTQMYEACARGSATRMAARLQQPDAASAATLALAQEPAVLAAFEPAQCLRTARALAGLPMVQVPTLVLAQAETTATALAQHPLWPQLRADEQLRWLRLSGALTAQDHALARQREAVSRAIVGVLARAGVTVLAGTDSPMPRLYPGLSLHEELERLVEAGLPPAAALRGATVQAWALLGRADEGGSVEAGKVADLVLLDADPLRDIRNTRTIRAVIVDGRLLSTEGHAERAGPVPRDHR